MIGKSFVCYVTFSDKIWIINLISKPFFFKNLII
jgi:hypothetical protein